MRDRVVHMQQVQVVEFRNFRHASSERKVVGRVIEQRITRHFHFVIMNVRLRASEPDGLRIGYEMDLMPPQTQLEAKFGGYDSASTVRGIAGNPDFHSAFPRLIPDLALVSFCIRWQKYSRDSDFTRPKRGFAARVRMPDN